MDIASRNLQVIRKGELKYALAAADSFVAEVVPGESFEVETELNIGGHLITRLDEKLDASKCSRYSTRAHTFTSGMCTPCRGMPSAMKWEQ